MKTLLSILGILVVGVLLFALKSEQGREEIGAVSGVEEPAGELNLELPPEAAAPVTGAEQPSPGGQLLTRSKPPVSEQQPSSRLTVRGSTTTPPGGQLRIPPGNRQTGIIVVPPPAQRASLQKAQLLPSVGKFQLLNAFAGGGLVSQERSLMAESTALKAIVDDLNRQFRLPRNVTIRLSRCGLVNAFYSPAKSEITICDEFVNKMVALFGTGPSDTQLAPQVVSSTAFVFAHEVGHALLHQLNISFTGPQETVADQYAVHLLYGSAAGQQHLLTAAEMWGRMAKENKPIMWDNHPLDEQRRYFILCWVYGLDPDRYQGLVTSGALPAQRARSCPKEAADMVRGLNERIVRHLR